MKVFLNSTGEALYYSKTSTRTLAEIQAMDSDVTEEILNAPDTVTVKTNNCLQYCKKVSGDGSDMSHYEAVDNTVAVAAALVVSKAEKQSEVDAKTLSMIYAGDNYATYSSGLTTLKSDIDSAADTAALDAITDSR